MALWVFRAIAIVLLLAAAALGATAVAPEWDATLRHVVQDILPREERAAPVVAQADPLALYSNAVFVSGEEVDDHFLGPTVSIHVPGVVLPYAIMVATVVDEHGDVVAAVAANGRPTWRTRAEGLVRSQRYEPFIRDGKPVTVIFDSRVPVVRSERRLNVRAPIPEITDHGSLRLELDRGWCYGACPNYKIEVYGDGAVNYEGVQFVALLRRHRAKLPAEAVADLVERFRQADFMSIEDFYQAAGHHLQGVKLCIHFDGRSKCVMEYSGRDVGLPDVVIDLQNAIDRTTNTRRWTKGDAATAPSLVAEGWDFKSKANENLAMIAGLAAYGDARALERVIALGAPVAATADLRQSRSAYPPTNALDSAVQRGDPEILRVLLAARAPWTRRQFGEALLSAADRGDIAMVAPLIEAGADPKYRRPIVERPNRGRYEGPGRQGRTVLMSASASGNPDVVAEILKAKPDVNARDEYGFAALHCAAHPYYSNAKHQNRARVVDLLVAAGADLEARNDAGKTPLMASEYYGDAYPEVRAALINAGAKQNAPR